MIIGKAFPGQDKGNAFLIVLEGFDCAPGLHI